MDRNRVITGLNDIGGFIAGRIGHEQAKNFLHTIDEAIALLKERDKTRLETAHEIIAESVLMYQGKELVQCKDCKHYDKDIIYCNKFGIQDIDGNWFCADGERSQATVK